MTKTALVFMTATLTLSGTAPASAQDSRALRKPFYEATSEHCRITASGDRPGGALRLDIGRKNPGQACAFTRAETIALFQKILDTHEENNGGASYSSLMLGSLENYAWMQQHLTETARRDQNWSQKTGKPVSGHENTYVNGILNRPEIIEAFNQAGAKHGYRFSGASCEKVFISEEGLPYDAFCWIEMTADRSVR